MKMRALPQILGKTIKAVLVSESNRAGPPAQLFLIFTDNTALEIYGELGASGSLDAADLATIQTWVQTAGGIVHFFESAKPDVDNA